jgi:hypothetical protein
MTEITLKLTFEELKALDKYVDHILIPRPLFDKIRNAYPKPETLYDVIRNLGYSVDMCDEIVDAVEEFQKPKEYQPTPQTPEQVADGLKEAFRTAIKEGIIPEIKQPTDELIEKLVKKPPEFLKFELGKTLTDLIYQWWGDVFTTHSDWDMETSIEDLVDQIQLWLPKEQSAAGSQSLGVEDMVEGFNDAIKKIKSKLRNKKDT